MGADMGFKAVEEERTAYMACCYFKSSEEHQAFLKWDGRPPLPVCGTCLVKLTIPAGALYVSPGKSPGRCSRAFAEDVMDLSGCPIREGVACSMYDTEFICRPKEALIPPRPLETGTATERFTGIHYFDTMEDALRWAGKG